jgi:hypothetical protein
VIGIQEAIRRGIKPGIRSSINSGGTPSGFSFPTTPGEMKYITGGYGNWSSIWTCNERSGNLVDRSGSITLVAGTTPTYRQAGPIAGKYAVGFNDNQVDTFAASSAGTYNLDATGEIAVIVVFKCGNINDAGHRHLFTKSTSAYVGYGMYLHGVAETIQAYAYDGVSFVQAGVAGDVADSNWHVAFMTISRGGINIIRAAVDAVAPTQADITAVGTLANAEFFRLGALPAGGGSRGEALIAYVAVSTTDVQSMRTLDTSIISKFKASTGIP